MHRIAPVPPASPLVCLVACLVIAPACSKPQPSSGSPTASPVQGSAGPASPGHGAAKPPAIGAPAAGAPAAGVPAASGQPKPPAKAPGDVAAAQPQPATPAATVSLTAPTDAASLATWAAAKGCPWAAVDGSEVLCWWQHKVGDTLQVALELRRAPGLLKTRWLVYEGPATFAASGLRAAAIRSARAWQSDHRAIVGQDVRSPVQITHNQFTLMWGTTRWRMPLRKPPALAPTPKLARRESLCCRWAPEDATHYAKAGLVAVRLRLGCTWRTAPNGPQDVCADPAYAPGAPVPPTYTLHFVPVGAETTVRAAGPAGAAH